MLALVLAGGAGGRLDVLTRERAKPAMPYGGVYRLVDFPLSNCHHSRVSDVWVIQQYQPEALSTHLANGRPWDLDRTHGGLRVVHPSLGGSDEEGFYRGNADAIFRHKDEIEAFGAETLLVLSADHVYKLDYTEVVARHADCGAEATVVTTRVPREEAGRFGTVEVGGDGRITGFEYKPDEPSTDVVTTEVFAYDARTLLDALDELAGAEGELEDFGDDLLPRLVERGRVFEHPLDGYWKDVGTIESYWEAHMELVAAEPPIDLDDPSWPILTRSRQRPPARVDGASVEAALLSPGAVVRGNVVRSVLGPGVVVEEGAMVRDAVLLDDVTVERGAVVERAILDEGVHVGAEARIGAAGAEIVVVGAGARVEQGEEVAPGVRIEPQGQLRRMA